MEMKYLYLSPTPYSTEGNEWILAAPWKRDGDFAPYSVKDIIKNGVIDLLNASISRVPLSTMIFRTIFQVDGATI